MKLTITESHKGMGKRVFHSVMLACLLCSVLLVVDHLKRLSELNEMGSSVFGQSTSLHDATNLSAAFFIQQWQAIPPQETSKQAQLVDHWFTAENVIFIGLYSANGAQLYKMPNDTSIKQILKQYPQVVTTSIPFNAHDEAMQIMLMVDSSADSRNKKKTGYHLFVLFITTASIGFLLGAYFLHLMNYLRAKARQ